MVEPPDHKESRYRHQSCKPDYRKPHSKAAFANDVVLPCLIGCCRGPAFPHELPAARAPIAELQRPQPGLSLKSSFWFFLPLALFHRTRHLCLFSLMLFKG